MTSIRRPNEQVYATGCIGNKYGRRRRRRGRLRGATGSGEPRARERDRRLECPRKGNRRRDEARPKQDAPSEHSEQAGEEGRTRPSAALRRFIPRQRGCKRAAKKTDPLGIEVDQTSVRQAGPRARRSRPWTSGT